MIASFVDALRPGGRVQRTAVCLLAALAAACAPIPERIGAPSEWLPSPNFNERRPAYVVLHHTSNDRVDRALRTLTDPVREVSAHYVVARDGKVYQGVLVYDSPEGTLIQTAGDTTTRIAGDEIVRTTKTTQSLMPTGLLNGLADGEIADLVAYLKTLAPTRQE